MFRHLLTIAIRNILKYFNYSLLNIIGLAIGISSFLFILIYVSDELKYDRFHKNAGDIYRISVHVKWEGREGENQQFLPTVGPALKQDYPQVSAFLRIRGPRSNISCMKTSR